MDESPRSPPQSIGNLASGVLNRREKRRSAHREKVFGKGHTRRLDRNEKVRITIYAEWLAKQTDPATGTRKLQRAWLPVLKELLWRFHNAKTGVCFPSYATIAKAAAVAISTVYEALKALERFGLLSWVNRLRRTREHCSDLLGHPHWRWRVVRTSNAYTFGKSPHASNIENRAGTFNQDSSLLDNQSETPKIACSPELQLSLDRLFEGIKRRADT